jgi:hypothetical protein
MPKLAIKDKEPEIKKEKSSIKIDKVEDEKAARVRLNILS